MTENLDPRIVELLCSHLCHELISPVTAVNNGLELVGDGDSELLAEALGLMRQSASEASRKLQFYRLAYGQAAAFDGARGLQQARELTDGLLQGGKVTLNWSQSDKMAIADKPSVKLLLNILALAREALPRGGVVAVTIGPSLQTEVTASGPGARLSPEVQAAMEPNVNCDSLTPRTVHAYLIGWLDRGLNASFAVEIRTPDQVLFRIRLGAGS